MYKVIESKTDNTIFEVREENGQILSYRITPKEGYKLHEITLDEKVSDEYGNETGEIREGFTTSYITAGANYDFKENTRQIYAVEEEKE